MGDGYAEDMRLIHLFDGGQGGAACAHRCRAWRSLPDSRELVFFQAMRGFHVALVGVGGRWDAHVLAIAEGLGKIGLELAAIVGLPDQVAQRAALAIQMPLDTDGKDRAGRSAALPGEGPERQTAANLHKCRYSTARSCLQPRQPESNKQPKSMHT